MTTLDLSVTASGVYEQMLRMDGQEALKVMTALGAYLKIQHNLPLANGRPIKRVIDNTTTELTRLADTHAEDFLRLLESAKIC